MTHNPLTDCPWHIKSERVLWQHEQSPRPSKYHGESYPRQSGYCRAPPHGRGIRLVVGCDHDNGPLSFGGLRVVESRRSVLLYVGMFFTGTSIESNLAEHERFITLRWPSSRCRR